MAAVPHCLVRNHSCAQITILKLHYCLFHNSNRVHHVLTLAFHAAQVEEFGNGAYKSPPDLAIQNPVYKAVYDPYLSYLKTGQPDVHGVAFWQWVFSPGLNASYSDSIYAL